MKECLMHSRDVLTRLLIFNISNFSVFLKNKTGVGLYGAFNTKQNFLHLMR